VIPKEREIKRKRERGRERRRGKYQWINQDEGKGEKIKA
jgi:hypothetical protein